MIFAIHPPFLPKEFLLSADTYTWKLRRKEEKLMGLKVKGNDTLYGEEGRSLAVRYGSDDGKEKD